MSIYEFITGFLIGMVKLIAIYYVINVIDKKVDRYERNRRRHRR